MTDICKFWQVLNSHRQIPIEVFLLHQIHCGRFLTNCPNCHQRVPKKTLQQHQQQYHRKETCCFCSCQFPVQDLATHKTICQQRPQPCQFCGAVMDLHSLTNHEDYCGSRTQTCDICLEPIPMKYIAQHLQDCLDQIGKVKRRARPVKAQKKKKR